MSVSRVERSAGSLQLEVERLDSKPLDGSRSIKRVEVNSLHLQAVPIATKIELNCTRPAQTSPRSRLWLKGLATVAALLVLACVPLHAQPASNAQSARAMQLVRFVVPEFPAFMRQAGVLQGTVVAAIGRNLQGVPDDVLVLESSDPRFSDAALEAIREWRFETTAKSGTATEDSVHVVRFLFTSGAVSIVPLTASSGAGSRRGVRADTPVELPNFSHLDAVPQTVRSPNPEFPAALRGRVPEGTVVVKYFVDRTGQVRLPVLISATDPEFGAAAIATMRQWRYEPPLIDGKPVIALERHSFQFRAPNTR